MIPRAEAEAQGLLAPRGIAYAMGLTCVLFIAAVTAWLIWHLAT